MISNALASTDNDRLWRAELRQLALAEYDQAQKFGEEVLSRIDCAAYPRFVEVSIGAWRPQATRCHANATTWAKFNPEWSRVRGFLVYGLKMPFATLVAHSVVRSPEGGLCDITPGGDASRPFVPHVGDPGEFEWQALVGSHFVARSTDPVEVRLIHEQAEELLLQIETP